MVGKPSDLSHTPEYQRELKRRAPTQSMMSVSPDTPWVMINDLVKLTCSQLRKCRIIESLDGD